VQDFPQKVLLLLRSGSKLATSLSFPLPVAMPFVGFSGVILGASPDNCGVA
jgi:hypothetical protein